jgi:G3E family GTPase
VTVPLVVITGFLGAGKTTLINRLLARRAARDAGGKLGVIVNELGEIGIDGALLGGDAARQIELPGGCVCCVLGDELGETLVELVTKNPGLDAIVLETTGVAEPLPIAWAVEREPARAHVRLAAVVTLVDAANFLASRKVSTSVDAQVAYADVLLVTKANPGRDNSVAEDAGGDRDHCDSARAIAVAQQLAPRALLRDGSTDDHAAWLEAVLADPDVDARVSSPDGQAAGAVDVHHHTDDCRHLDSSAAHGIDSVWVPVDEPVDLEELSDQLAELPANYVRIKGIVRVRTADNAARWVAVHRVGPRVSSEPLLDDAPGAPGAPGSAQHQQGRIVALGPAVDRADLARCIAIASS